MATCVICYPEATIIESLTNQNIHKTPYLNQYTRLIDANFVVPKDHEVAINPVENSVSMRTLTVFKRSSRPKPIERRNEMALFSAIKYPVEICRELPNVIIMKKSEDVV